MLGTANVLMAAVLGRGRTYLEAAAMASLPHNSSGLPPSTMRPVSST